MIGSHKRSFWPSASVTRKEMPPPSPTARVVEKKAHHSSNHLIAKKVTVTGGYKKNSRGRGGERPGSRDCVSGSGCMMLKSRFYQIYTILSISVWTTIFSLIGEYIYMYIYTHIGMHAVHNEPKSCIE